MIYNDCKFCNFAYPDNKIIEEFNQQIFSSKNFFLIPAMGQLTDGYVLLCPKKHFKSMGELDKDLHNEYYKFKNYVYNLLSEEYGRKPIFFEHGSSLNHVSGGSSIEHAHLHAIPVELYEVPSIISKNLLGNRIETYHEVFKLSKLGKPYFYFELSNGNMYLYDATTIDPQFGRKVIAHVLGVIDMWDWKIYPTIEKMINTQRKLKDYLKLNEKYKKIINF